MLPGPPLNFLAILFLKLYSPNTFSWLFIIIMAVLTIVVTVLDYILPVWGAKIYKASKYGIWGSITGMLIGILFFPPWGMIAGLLIGAVIGELIAGKDKSDAFKVGFVTLLASFIMIIIKLIISGIMTSFFLFEIIKKLF